MFAENPALEARAFGVIADYQDDSRIPALRVFWPELATSLDDLIAMYVRISQETEGTEKK